MPPQVSGGEIGSHPIGGTTGHGVPHRVMIYQADAAFDYLVEGDAKFDKLEQGSVAFTKLAQKTLELSA